MVQEGVGHRFSNNSNHNSSIFAVNVTNDQRCSTDIRCKTNEAILLIILFDTDPISRLESKIVKHGTYLVNTYHKLAKKYECSTCIYFGFFPIS